MKRPAGVGPWEVAALALEEIYNLVEGVNDRVYRLSIWCWRRNG